MGSTAQMHRSTEVKQADGDRGTESPLAQPIRESAVRIRRFALGADGVRYVDALVRLEFGADPGEMPLLSPIALDQYVSRAISAMEALSVAELEALAARYAL